MTVLNSDDQTTLLEKLTLSLNAAHMGTWEWDENQFSGQWDPRMYEIHGFTKPTKPQLFADLRPLMLPEDYQTLREKFLEVSSQRGELNTSYRIQTPTGETRYIRCFGRYLEAAHRIMYGVAWDATEEILAQRELEIAQAKLIAGAKMAALGEMTGGIAHEINNPLTVIQARAFQLTQMVENHNLDPEKIQKAAESISRTADKIARIIKSMRSFSREGSSDPFTLVPLSEIINNTLEFCRARFYNHGVEVQQVGIDEDIEVECRIVQIEQVLLNLLNNSFDAVQNSPLNTDKWIRIEASVDDQVLELRITDSGPGVAPEIVEKIMQPFFTTKEPGNGTGLGLSISVDILKAHKGQLFLIPQATPTTFVIRLPLFQDSEAVVS